MNKNNRLTSCQFLRLAGFAACLVGDGLAFGDIVNVDLMTAKQGTDANPAVMTNIVGNTATSAPFSDASILWGSRILQVTHTDGEGPYTSSYVDSGTPSVWGVANPPGSSGWGQIVWNGSNDPGALAVTPLDLSLLQYFNIAFVSSDQPTSYILQVYSDVNHCSQATISTFGLGGGTDLNKRIVPTDFTQCSGATGLAQQDSIRKIQISHTPYFEIDAQLRGVSVVRNEPPIVQCGEQLINGQSTDHVVGEGPHTLPVEFTVKNTGGSPSKIIVEEQLPANTAYVEGSTHCDGGFVLDEPDLTNPSMPVWKSITTLAKGASALCRFDATLSTIAEGETATAIVMAGVRLGQLGPEQCPASVARLKSPPPPSVIPTMNEWAMMLAASLLVILGGLKLRTKKGVVDQSMS